MLDTSKAVLALLCDTHGRVEQILRDEFQLAGRIELGQLFPVLVDRGSFWKAQDFLLELRGKGAAFDWELNIMLDEQMLTLHFAGGCVDDKLLIVGAGTGSSAQDMYEALLLLNKDQANLLRAAMKNSVAGAVVQTKPDSDLYDQLSRLNNELITTQRELAKKNAELAQLNVQKNHFLGMAAHDLRNPLQVIMTYSDFLLDEAAAVLTEEHQSFLNVIRSSSTFMLNLVNDLLDVSTIEAGQLSLDMQALDLLTVAQRNVALNRVLAAKKDINLVLEHDDAIPTLLADPAKIEQVFNNLISNALKYSYPQSTVVVQLHNLDEAIQLVVQDEGQGIPAEELDTLCEMYSKTSVRGTDGEKSTGLGLAITKQIVLAHGGQIDVTSQVDEGTTVYVTLPPIPNEDGQHG